MSDGAIEWKRIPMFDPFVVFHSFRTFPIDCRIVVVVIRHFHCVALLPADWSRIVRPRAVMKTGARLLGSKTGRRFSDASESSGRIKSCRRRIRDDASVKFTDRFTVDDGTDGILVAPRPVVFASSLRRSEQFESTFTFVFYGTTVSVIGSHDVTVGQWFRSVTFQQVTLGQCPRPRAVRLADSIRSADQFVAGQTMIDNSTSVNRDLTILSTVRYFARMTASTR